MNSSCTSVEHRLRLPPTFMEEQGGSRPISLKASSSAATLDAMASKHKLDEPALLPRKDSRPLNYH